MNYLEVVFKATAHECEHLMVFLEPFSPMGFEETPNGLTAYFDPTQRTELESALKERLWRVLNRKIEWETTEKPYEDWGSSWKKDYHPLAVGERFWIYPSWSEAAIPQGRIALAIDPGMSFGTGLHASTQLCMAAMEEKGWITADTKLLDVGTGTGILAMAAAKLGAKKILAIDNDPQCVLDTQENIKLNHVPFIEVRQASLEEMVEQTSHAAPQQFERITANLLLELHLKWMHLYHQFLAVGGKLLLSGILIEQKPQFAEFERQGFKKLREAIQGEWVLLEYERR